MLLIRTSKWYPTFLCSKRQSTNGKEFDTYKVGTVANSCSTMHKIMSKPITLESFEIDDYNDSIPIDRADQSSLTDVGRECGFTDHWHMEEFVDYIIIHCEDMRQYYIKLQEQMKAAEDEGERKRLEYDSYCVWKELIRWLPEGWLQKRTVTLTYENLHAICSKSQRYFHKLNEWSGRRNPELLNFIKWVREEIPYAEDFILYHETEDEEKKHQEKLEFCKIFLSGVIGAHPYLFNATDKTSSITIADIELPPFYSEETWMKALEVLVKEKETPHDRKIMFTIKDDILNITMYKKNEEA